MSDHKYILEISNEAEDDLTDIQSYTFKEFGEKQWEKYSLLLEQGLEHILCFPYSGHVRKDIPKNYLSWPVEEHIMIYRIEGELVYLIRVLHKKMNFLRWLG